jgi:hypothetical protein
MATTVDVKCPVFPIHQEVPNSTIGPDACYLGGGISQLFSACTDKHENILLKRTTAVSFTAFPLYHLQASSLITTERFMTYAV